MGFISREMIVRKCKAIGNEFSKDVPHATVCKYILALLTLKRSSDLFDEANMIWSIEDDDYEYRLADEEIRKEAEHNIVLKMECLVPESAKWSNFIHPDSSLGNALNKGFSDLIDTNKNMHFSLYSFKHLNPEKIDFNSPLLGNEGEKENILSEAVSYISSINLGNHALENNKALSDAVDEIIDHFVSQETDLFITPESVSKLLIELSEIESNVLLVPQCGEGKIIQHIIEKIRIEGFETQNIGFQTMESDSGLYFISCMRMFLQDNYRIEILPKNIVQREFENNGSNGYFKSHDHTHVLGSIPLEIQKRTESEQEYIRGDRFSYGIPLNKKSEFSYLVGMLKNTVSGGKLVVAVPPSLLYKQRSEGEVRKNMILDDLIEAVIQLPPKMYSANPHAYAILVIRPHKLQKDRMNKILFIDASKDFIEEKKQNHLSDETINEIVDLYRHFKVVKGKSFITTKDIVSNNEYSLDINRYTQPSHLNTHYIDAMEELIQLKEKNDQKSQIIDNIIDSIKKLEVLRRKTDTRAL